MTLPTSVQSPPATKVKKTLSLDPDVPGQVIGSEGEGNLSRLVNSLLKEEVERRQRQLALRTIPGDLESELGPVDEELVDHYPSMLQ